MARVGEKPIYKHDRSERFAKSYPENEKFLTWLASEEKEEVIEPEIPIVDTHHHLWDHRGAKGVEGQVVYKLPEILEDMNSGHNVVKTVFAEAHAFYNAGATVLPKPLSALGEVEYCQGVAALCESETYGQTRVCAGIIGSANFADPQVDQLLNAQLRVRNFRGIRTNPARAEDPNFCKGMEFLAKHDLVFEWSGFSPKRYNEKLLPSLRAIAEKFPTVRIVMNHCGAVVGPTKMPTDGEDFQKWKRDIADVAKACPNVIAKVGGGQMPLNKPAFGLKGPEKRPAPIGSEELCRLMLPYYGHLIDCFGVERCMFESNFPVDRDSVSHKVLFNCFKRIAAQKGLSADQKKAIFHDTAVRVYRLNDAFGAKL